MVRNHPLATVARPKQARSERTLHRILDVTEELIEEKGLADLSIPEIVRRAGSSVGGFYARFRDKNELLRALEERFFADERVHLTQLTRPERWKGASLPEMVRACATELVRTTRERQALVRAFVARAVHDVEFRGDTLRFRRQASERMTALLLTRRDEIRHPDPERAVDLGVQLAFAMMTAWVVFGDVRAAGVALSDEALIEELSRNFLGYLGVVEPSPRRRRR